MQFKTYNNLFTKSCNLKHITIYSLSHAIYNNANLKISLMLLILYNNLFQKNKHSFKYCVSRSGTLVEKYVNL